MQLPRRLLQLIVLFSIAVANVSTAADSATTPAGYWVGAIVLPNQELGVSIELVASADPAWQGTIDIPVQGMRGFKLDPVKVADSSVEFGLPGIPGDPRFAGALAADGQTIAGEFTQGGNSFPFRLQRTPKPASAAREALPAKGVPGEGLIGHWQGGLSPLPNIELRLALEIAADANSQPGGVLVSLDQGNARIPLAQLTHLESEVTFQTPQINGSYRGTMNVDGSEITGEWTQNGRTLPLVFKRLPAATP